MNTQELYGMSDDELGMQLRDTEKHLFQLRFQSATDRLETPSEIAKAKKLIARIKTIQRERELELLAELSTEELQAQRDSLEERLYLPGKRRVQRALKRLDQLLASHERTAQ